MCIFTVAVYGADELDSQYQLTARHPISHIILKESETHRSYIELGDKEYYKFTVNDDHNITQIIFKVTAISGDIDVYISNSDKIKHPNIVSRRCRMGVCSFGPPPLQLLSETGTACCCGRGLHLFFKLGVWRCFFFLVFFFSREGPCLTTIDVEFGRLPSTRATATSLGSRRWTRSSSTRRTIRS